MKAEELLFSLEHVGEDLLAGAEQTVLARKHRPWFGAAAAAVLLVALGVGGFLLWQDLRGGVPPAATGDEPGPVATQSPEPTENPGMLPPLTVGESWKGLSRARFDDPERSAAGSLVKAYGNLASLPVYEREGGVTGDPAHRFTEEQLAQRLFRAADWMGIWASDDLISEYEETDDGTTRLLSYSSDTSQGTLTVYADGRILMLFDEAHAITSSVKVELSGDLSPAETERALRDARMEDCGEKLAERLGLGDCGFVTCDRWDPSSSAWTVFTVYPLREDPAEQLVSRYFESVRLLTNDGWTLRGFELDRFPREDLTQPPEGLRLAGTYPVIAPGEAANALDEDAFLCEEEDLDRGSVYANAHWEQLVYLPENGSELLMPFYRFWVPADGTEDEYLAVYVPAVRESYLTDWELYRAIRLPSLTVGEVAKGEPALLLTDREAYLASNPWREEERINTLPVYELPETGSAEGSLYLFDEDKRYAPENGAGFTGSERSEGLIRAFADRVIWAAGLNSSLPWGVVEGEYPLARTVPGVDEPLYAAEIFPLTNGSAAGRVENYSLARVTLWYRDGVLYGFTLPAYAQPYLQFLEPIYADVPVGVEDPDSFRTEPAETELPIGEIGVHTQAGLYPIITPAEARKLAWAGKYAGSAVERPAGGLALLPTYFTSPEELIMDLVYLPNEDGSYLMPFYRFLYPIGGNTETGAEVCDLGYVPAVTPLYLADYPEPDGTEPEETEPEETEPEETEPEETEPEPPISTGGRLPAPVESAEGRFEIQGLAGNVEALTYIGGCQDPVWADVDGDGETELVYWCYGPTSGLFTVGICVYGLHEGWPVLEAAQIYNLASGSVSLKQEDGTVWFCRQPTAEQGNPGEPLRLAVTLSDGKLVLNGGSLKGVQEWGGAERSWFGTSFEALKAEVKDRCVFTHWACLVWTEPKETESGTRQYVFAAVSENGVTVTGLLRYQQQPDGSWFCARQGLELIDAPEDPAALSGLTMEELEARFGPCHFDMGSGMYIPCWFTKDCRMLVVHMGGAANSAELRPLIASGD